MKGKHAILFLVIAGLFLTSGLASAITVVPETSYLFTSNTNPQYGAYVNVEVTAEETNSSPFDDGVGTFYLYTFSYWVDNTGPKNGDFDQAIGVIDYLRFVGAPIVSFDPDPGSGDVGVTYSYDAPNAAHQFDFAGVGLEAGQVSDKWSVSSYFVNGLLSDINQVAVLQDAGQTSYGDLQSDLLVPSGSPITQAPEPGTLLLVGGGLLAFAGLRLRRNRRK